jgi:hypothetical protein
MKPLECGTHTGETKGLGTVITDPVFEKIP